MEPLVESSSSEFFLLFRLFLLSFVFLFRRNPVQEKENINTEKRDKSKKTTKMCASMKHNRVVKDNDKIKKWAK